MPGILVVDDEASILNLITSYIRSEGFEYYTASDGETALKAARTYKPDVVILDIMLPKMDGLEVLARLRQESNTYVILLTARAEEVDKIIGLSVGADDYVTKPFSPRELMARLKAALRRLRTAPAQDGDPKLVFQHLSIDPNSRKAAVDGKAIELTAIEFDLLYVLAENRGRVLTREQLLEKVWGYDFYGDTRVVDVHMGHIRQKLERKLIDTVRGVGYRFEDYGS